MTAAFIATAASGDPACARVWFPPADLHETAREHRKDKRHTVTVTETVTTVYAPEVLEDRDDPDRHIHYYTDTVGGFECACGERLGAR